MIQLVSQRLRFIMRGTVMHHEPRALGVQHAAGAALTRLAPPVTRTIFSLVCMGWRGGGMGAAAIMTRQKPP